LSKKDLLTEINIKINGRKRYLMTSKDNYEGRVPDSRDMQTQAQVLRAPQKTNGASASKRFVFRINFENLSPEELELLLASTGAPEYGNMGVANNQQRQSFKHQIGMAKPYGYGRIQMHIDAVFIKSPTERYASLSTHQIYSQYYDGFKVKDVKRIKRHKRLQDPAINQLIKNASVFKLTACQAQPNAAFSLINKTAYQRLVDISIPDKLLDNDIKIHYPRSTKADDKGFEWFMNNDSAGSKAQQLGSVVNTDKLPTLEKNSAPKPKPRHPKKR
ncbi:MAG: hypothetical protein ACPGPF_06175, partial [Pontibacterium sp.]